MKNPKGTHEWIVMFLSHSWQADKWANQLSPYISAFRDFPVHSSKKKRFTCPYITKGSQNITNPKRSNSTEQRTTLFADDCCSDISSAPPITFLPAFTVDYDTLLGAREKVHASFPLNPLAPSGSICYQSKLLVILIIKNTMDTQQCVWLDSFKKLNPVACFFIISEMVLIKCLK